MTKILVTGGAGFIGSNLVSRLESTGNRVTVIDNLSSGNKNNLKGFKGKLIVSDVSKEVVLKENFDLIYHLASITDTTCPSDRNMMLQNFKGFQNILEFTKIHNSKLVYASSAAVYGKGKVPMKESQKKMPLNAYAQSKLMMDKLAERHFNNMHIVGLRYFNAFGPGEKYKGKSASMIYQLTKKMLKGERPKLFRYGQQKRDFIFIEDVVQTSFNAQNTKKSGVYNVGTGVSTSFNDILNMLNVYLDKSIKPIYIQNKINHKYQTHTKADTRLSTKFLNFKAKYKLAEAIKIYVDYIRKENE